MNHSWGLLCLNGVDWTHDSLGLVGMELDLGWSRGWDIE